MAAFVYSLYGFNGVLLRDYSIYLYSGQRLAEGVPPYVSVFDHKGPLSPMLAGLGVMLSKWLSWDDLYTVRLVFFAVGCLTVVAVYLLGKNMFRSQVAGFFGALTFLGFYAYAQPAASGPEPKTPMVLFQALSLLLAIWKRWFWAGFFGSLAFLVWQPMGVFALATFVLAVTRPREERYGAALRALAGIMAPLVATVAYFYYQGALGDFIDGFILFNFLYLIRWDSQLVSVLAGAAGSVALPYGTMIVPIILGLITIARLYFLRPYQYRFAPILLSFPAPVLWSLRDFQLADDFFVFLPYAAIGFGALLAFVINRAKSPRLVAALLSVVLIAVALVTTLEEVNAPAAYTVLGTEIDLSQQREGALEIEDRLGEDAKIASINSPQVLALLHRENPNPYPFITAGVDRQIEAETPGGFEGWLRELEEYDPDAIAFFGEGQYLLPTSDLTTEHYHELVNWLNSRYHVEKIGPWWLYIKGPQ
ncbi:MAG: glycosyltransferase family 39 protein [Actinomycetota bacterium]|nr:glycosyltransferase family 39 protein [Actinomycetota bacterium]